MKKSFLIAIFILFSFSLVSVKPANAVLDNPFQVIGLGIDAAKFLFKLFPGKTEQEKALNDFKKMIPIGQKSILMLGKKHKFEVEFGKANKVSLSKKSPYTVFFFDAIVNKTPTIIAIVFETKSKKVKEYAKYDNIKEWKSTDFAFLCKHLNSLKRVHLNPKDFYHLDFEKPSSQLASR